MHRNANSLSSLSSSSSSKVVEPAKKRKGISDHGAVSPEAEELMLTLINAGVPNTVGLCIIMGYVIIPSLRETSPFDFSNPTQFFISRPQYTFFGYNLSDLAELDKHCIWGRPEEVKAILDRNRDPLLLSTSIDGEDHRGPGFIPPGTLFERAAYVGDVFIKDKMSRETMAGMLKCYVIERCGIDEFKRQAARAQQVIKEDNAVKATIEPDDLIALNNVWFALKKADKNNLDNDAELITAMAEFDNQLRKPGNAKILQKIAEFYERDYVQFGGYSTSKNNFAANRIHGLAQLRRLSVCDLQTSFPGLVNVFNGNEDVAIMSRIDARNALGVPARVGPAEGLGSTFHLDIHTGGPVLGRADRFDFMGYRMGTPHGF